MNDKHILLVDDTKALAELYAKALECEGYDVTCAHSGAQLLHILQTESFAPSLLILDVKLPDTDGIQLLGKLKESGFDAPVIVITGYGSIHTAVEAMRAGAADFLIKPFPLDKLVDSVKRSMAATGLSTKAAINRHEDLLTDKTTAEEVPFATRTGLSGFIGISPPMQLVYDIAESAAKSNATVFLTGESGTGKEVCAEAIHRLSLRAKQPFIAINCAAIPHNLLESELFGHVKGAFTDATSDRAGAVSLAHNGTLFLDEIAEMSPDMQTKLLRFLQNLTYCKVGSGKTEKANVRIVCATNRDPLAEITKGKLRQDLYYRLHVIPIHMPPLRERKSDVMDLADHFLRIYAKEEGKAFRAFAQDAEKILLSYDWPGNVRELQNIVRGVVVLHDGKFVTAPMLPSALRPGHERESVPPSAFLKTSPAPVRPDPINPLWQVERDAIEKAIELCDGNIPKAAALLEISPSTIYRKKMQWDQQSTPWA